MSNIKCDYALITLLGTKLYMSENKTGIFGQNRQKYMFWLKMTCFRQNVSSRTKEKMIVVFPVSKALLKEHKTLVFRAKMYFFQLKRVQSFGPLELTWKIENFTHVSQSCK